MALSFSTGFKNEVLLTAGVRATFSLGTIKIYASAATPVDADAALGTVTELVEYTVGGGATGLTLENAAANGIINKEPTETWQGTAASTGTALFWRFEKTGDTGLASTTDKRIQGTIGGSGADIFVASTTFDSGIDYTLDFFSLSIPDL
jgi:hypothetical protein